MPWPYVLDELCMYTCRVCFPAAAAEAEEEPPAEPEKDTDPLDEEALAL